MSDERTIAKEPPADPKGRWRLSIRYIPGGDEGPDYGYHGVVPGDHDGWGQVAVLREVQRVTLMIAARVNGEMRTGK